MSNGRRPVIYVITNTVNGKQYVGQTWRSVRERWRKHCLRAVAKKGCRAIAAAIRKYGEDAFTIKVLRELQEESPQCDVDEAEIKAISSCGSLSPGGYNLLEGGKGGRPSPETLERMRVVNTGKVLSEEHRRKLSEAHKGRKRSSPEELAAIRRNADKLRGVPRSPEMVAKLSRAQKAKAQNPTEAMKARNARMHEAVRGRVQTPEERARRSASLKAHYAKNPRSAEACSKLSEVQKGRVFSAETRRKMSEARKRYLECQMDSQKICR